MNMTTRPNQNTATFPWTKFIDAVDKTHGIGVAPPAYRDFVKVHVNAMSGTGMDWHVHTLHVNGMSMDRYNFLSWHRWFVVQMEKRLQQVHPDVCIPYWDAINDRTMPTALQDKQLLKRWGVKRGKSFDASQLASPADVKAIRQIETFQTFQRTLERAIHGGVHNAVGGDMAGSSSPSDPLFWLHHANMDRLWAEWQASHTTEHPSNLTDVLQPTPIFGITVASVQDIGKLGYKYA